MYHLIAKLPEVRDFMSSIRLQAKELLQADASWLHLIHVHGWFLEQLQSTILT